MKICRPTNCLSHRTTYFSQLLKANLLTFICLNSAIITVDQSSKLIKTPEHVRRCSRVFINFEQVNARQNTTNQTESDIVALSPLR